MVDLTRAIRARLPKPFLLSHAPQTPYLSLSAKEAGTGGATSSQLVSGPGFYGSYMAIMAQVGDLVDFLNVQAYNNPPMEGCPTAPQILNNLVATPTVFPSPLREWGSAGLTMAPLKPSQLVLGQQQPPNGTQEYVTPWCANLNPGIGLMFWLNDFTPTTIATVNAEVDKWYPQAKGALSPRNRVVYYTNGCGFSPAQFVNPATNYSRCNTIILGFIYPVSSLPGGRASALCAANDLPDWACFGFYYSCGQAGAPGYDATALDSGFVQELAAWRAAEPGRRKIMLGVGGAAMTPPYSVWAYGNHVDTVAKGLAAFKARFESVNNGLTLDGFDIDYEDSYGGLAVQTKFPWQGPGGGGGGSGGGPGNAAGKSRHGGNSAGAGAGGGGTPLYATVGGGFALAGLCLVVLAVILSACIPGCRRAVYPYVGGAVPMAIVGAVAVVGIALLAANVQAPRQ
jgi:hypothetical protein